MKVVYVLPQAGLGGGPKVIAEHVTGLRARNHDAQVWGLTGDFRWFPRSVPHRKFRTTDELGAALRQTPAVKVATFWVTASWVASNLRPGERGYYLVQDEDELTYSGSEAGTSYKLGLTLVTESEFVTTEIERKHGVRCHNVGIGIDPAVFRPLPMIRERYRVLTPARTTSAGPAGLKGLDVALETLRHLAKLEPKASVVTFGIEDGPHVDWMPHAHVRAPSDRKLRELYSQSGVFLSCSRHEGFGLPMLEAMAAGCPVVCTDSHGNREFCRNWVTALVRGDPENLAEAAAAVARDDALSARLSAAGLGESARYRWGPVLDRLEGLYAGDPAAPAGVP